MNPTPENNPKALPRVGHYELIECIGRGGMGLVYSARDSRLGRDVAIKCLRTELFEPHYRERFRREALLLAKLNHPHIVHIYDFIETDDQLALVMELIDGQNLQIHLREQVVPINQRMQWLIQIAQGLAVAHDAGIIHRDLKAENVLINKHKQAKISDLGIAKSQDFNATLTDHVAGSYCSMSPEQAVGEKLDFKSDLFSFGILAYQLLCGAHPFGETENKLQIMQRIISHPPIPPTKHNPNLPPEICALLGQLLSKNPEKRPDNTHWVAAQLERLSPLVAETAFEVDDTQLVTDKNGKKTIGRTTKVKYTSHPTFETRYVASGSVGQSFNEFLQEYKALIVVALVFIVVTGGITAWLLQPKPPKYVAVIPPTLTAEGMQESQQELVKGAVYDAIQQSILQFDGYYLIPSEEIDNINGDIDTVRRAMSADELVTTDIECKVDVCKIVLTRLGTRNSGENERLLVQNSRTINALIDNYLSLAELIQSNTGVIFNKNVANKFSDFSEADYSRLLEIQAEYLTRGATREQLDTLDEIHRQTVHIETIAPLYKDIALDLYYENYEDIFLERLETFLLYDLRGSKNSLPYLLSLYHFYIEKGNPTRADETLRTIEKLHPNKSQSLELRGYLAISNNDYSTAIKLYKNAIKLKGTTTNYQNLATAYWYSGDTESAKQSLAIASAQSPNAYKVNQLQGVIALSEGEIEQSIASFKKVLSQRESVADMSNLGLAYLLNKDYENAWITLNQAHMFAPKNLSILLNLADTENLSGRKDQAMENYRKLVAEDNEAEKNTKYLSDKAQAYAHLGDFTKAINLLNLLQKTNHQSISTMYTAAVVQSLAGDHASATVNVENSIKGGVSKVWFYFPWFDALCKHKKFTALMAGNEKNSRCIHLPPSHANVTADELQ